MSVVKIQKMERSENFKSLQQLVPLELYVAVGVVDGNGIKRNRIVFRAKGTKQFYFLFPEGTEEVMRSAAPWLQALLEREVGDHASALPEEKSSDLPSGSPL